MSDIWSGIGNEIASADGEWLYKLGSEIRGPLAESALATKIANGNVPLDSVVAREGGEFHPLRQVAAFADAVAIAQKRIAAARAKRFGMIAAVALVVLIGGGSAAGYVIWQDLERKKAEEIAEAEAERARLAKLENELRNQKAPELVALVSLGAQEDVVIKDAKPKSTRGRRPRGLKRNGASAPPEKEESIASCQLSQGQIFNTLKKHLAKVNVCVEDEKGRDAANLPDVLSLEFVVKTDGNVTEFRIQNRHYRSGPMNNCMIKAFRRISFPASSGTNCPVTIPINIGG